MKLSKSVAVLYFISLIAAYLKGQIKADDADNLIELLLIARNDSQTLLFCCCHCLFFFFKGVRGEKKSPRQRREVFKSRCVISGEIIGSRVFVFLTIQSSSLAQVQQNKERQNFSTFSSAAAADVVVLRNSFSSNS